MTTTTIQARAAAEQVLHDAAREITLADGDSV